MSEQKTKTQQTVPTAYHDPSWDHQTNTSGSGTDEEMRNVDPSGLAGDSGRLSLRIDRAAVTSTQEEEENTTQGIRRASITTGSHRDGKHRDGKHELRQLIRFFGWVHHLSRRKMFFIPHQVLLWSLFIYHVFIDFYLVKTFPRKRDTNTTTVNMTTNHTRNATSPTFGAYDMKLFLHDTLAYYLVPIVVGLWLARRMGLPPVLVSGPALVRNLHPSHISHTHTHAHSSAETNVGISRYSFSQLFQSWTAT